MSILKTTLIIFYVALSCTIHAQDQSSEWKLVGDAAVTISDSTMDLFFGASPKSIAGQSDQIHMKWKNAYIEGENQTPYPIDMNLTLTVGQKLSKKGGVFATIDSLSGTITPVDSNHKVARVSLSKRGTWIGMINHVDGSGPNHLAFEAPIALFDIETDALIAQTHMVVSFNVEDLKSQGVIVTLLAPLNIFKDQRIVTADIAAALSSGELLKSNKVNPGFFYAELSSTELKSAEDSGHMLKWLDDASLALYKCGSDEFMEVDIHSLGFSSVEGESKTPFSLSMRYRPRLNYVDASSNKVALIEPLDGYLTFHYDDLDRVIPIGPGNHGDVDSKIVLSNGNLEYQLALNFKEESHPIALAKMDFTCTVNRLSGSSCQDLKLTDAIDQTGNSLSKRTVSDLLKRPQAFIDQKSFYEDQKSLIALKGGPACPEFAECPRCLTEGCLTSGSHCIALGISCDQGNCTDVVQ